MALLGFVESNTVTWPPKRKKNYGYWQHASFQTALSNALLPEKIDKTKANLSDAF
jgi:hypothetical protein